MKAKHEKRHSHKEKLGEQTSLEFIRHRIIEAIKEAIETLDESYLWDLFEVACSYQEKGARQKAQREGNF